VGWQMIRISFVRRFSGFNPGGKGSKPGRADDCRHVIGGLFLSCAYKMLSSIVHSL
jgi:hypothetical protein